MLVGCHQGPYFYLSSKWEYREERRRLDISISEILLINLCGHICRQTAFQLCYNVMLFLLSL